MKTHIMIMGIGGADTRKKRMITEMKPELSTHIK
jgi:hypothetical protein